MDIRSIFYNMRRLPDRKSALEAKCTLKGGGMKLSVWDFLNIGVAVAFFIVYLISKEQAAKDFCMTMIIGLGAVSQLERRMKDEKTSLKDNRVYQFSFALLFLSYGA